MPKQKTHSGAKDRVRVTKNGKVRTGSPNRNHFLQKKSGARKRRLAGLNTRAGAQSKSIKLMMGA